MVIQCAPARPTGRRSSPDRALPISGSSGISSSAVSVLTDTPRINEIAQLTVQLHKIAAGPGHRSEEHTSELQSRGHLVCRLLLEKKKKHKTKCNYVDYA